ncbi:MAG TPA: glucose-6-phosphate dehydrogenase assembly protein OpcA [bacterium]|nr:glucose-6-phosphate dehydrogenase assembly protein OpcA [bacterium]
MAPAVKPMRVAGTPERADVDGIERELRRLWSSLDGDPSPPPQAAAAQVTRICTLTLLAVVRNGRPGEAAALAQHLGERYPSRSIILDLPAAEAGAAPSVVRPHEGSRVDGRLDVEIALHCHAPGATGRQAVCCEQISVTAAGRAIARVPALVLPLLVPDLPVYLWWPEDPPSAGSGAEGTAADPAADLLRRLAEGADALIVDSGTMRRPVAGLAAVSSLAGRLPGGVRDLTWGRLTPWRDLLVQCFDPAPMRQALERLERIRIRTDGDAAAPSRAPDAAGAAASSGQERDPIAGLLLGGWLAGRLGWEPAGPARREGTILRALFWRGGGGLELAVEGGAGPIASLECAAGGSEPFSLSITRQSGAAAVDIETRLGRGRPRTTAAALAAPDAAALIGAELELAEADHVLRESLDIVLRIMSGVRA